MERKVTEWGCMQALIDFDGWRKWKGLAAEEEANKASKKGDSKADQKAALKALFSQPPKTRKERERESAQVGGPVGGAPAGLAGGGGATPATGRPKSPTQVRKAAGKIASPAEVNGYTDWSRSDSSASGSTVVLDKR
jgi:hypothetical protein